MATNLLSSEVSAGDQATASQYNNLRDDVLKNAGDYETTTGSANAYVLSIDTNYTVLTTGNRVRFQANFTNTGSSTLNPNSEGATTIQKYVGGSLTNLEAGDIVSGQECEVVYDGTVFQLLTPTGNDISSADKATLTDGSNADSLHEHGHSSFLTFDDTVINPSTGVTTDLYSYTVPANTLGTNNFICGKVFLEFTSSSNNTTFRLRYGSTTFGSIGFNSSTGAMACVLDFMLAADGGTGAQAGFLNLLGTQSDPASSNKIGEYSGATGTEDSTGALDLKIDVNEATGATVTSNFAYAVLHRTL